MSFGRATKHFSKIVENLANKTKPRIVNSLQISNLRISLGKIQENFQDSRNKSDEEKLQIFNQKRTWITTGGVLCSMVAIFGKPLLFLGVVPAVLYNMDRIKVLTRTFQRDMKFLDRYSRCFLSHRRVVNGDITVPEAFKHNAELDPHKVILQLKEQNWKYTDLISYANRASRLLQKYELTKGDVCGLLLANSPEAVAIILGSAQIGVISALIDYNLRDAKLLSAINNSNCRLVVYDDEFSPVVNEVRNKLHSLGVRVIPMRHASNNKTSASSATATFEGELLLEFDSEPEVFVKTHHYEPFLYLCGRNSHEVSEISHSEFIFGSRAASIMLNVKGTDKIYTPLPLWENAGIVCGVGPALTRGIPVVLRQKFSPVDYFRDCYIYNCTIGQYSGTMWKQLLALQWNPSERLHKLKIIFGTGMDANFWHSFAQRFNLTVHELGHVSPDNCNMVNFDGKLGAIGLIPKWLPKFMFPYYLIKCFGAENIPLRTFDGVCESCNAGESGLLVRMTKSEVLNLMAEDKRKINDVLNIGDTGICSKELYVLDEDFYLKKVANSHSPQK